MGRHQPGTPASLPAAMAGVDVVYIITPGHADRSALVGAGADAAKAAGVSHIVVVSVPSVVAADALIFKGQFEEIEAKVTGAGLRYTLLRVPMFFENQWASQGAHCACTHSVLSRPACVVQRALALCVPRTVVGLAHLGPIGSQRQLTRSHFPFCCGLAGTIKQGQLYGPANPAKSFTLIAVGDLAEAGANVLATPVDHVDKTYTVGSDTLTMNDITTAFAAAAGHKVAYVQVPYTAASALLFSRTFPHPVRLDG